MSPAAPVSRMRAIWNLLAVSCSIAANGYLAPDQPCKRTLGKPAVVLQGQHSWRGLGDDPADDQERLSAGVGRQPQLPGLVLGRAPGVSRGIRHRQGDA